MPAEIIALFVVSTPEVPVDPTELSITVEDRVRDLHVHVTVGPVDRSTGVPVAPDRTAQLRVQFDPHEIAISMNMTMDAFSACLLTCAVQGVVDIIINCRKHAKSVRELKDCLKKNGVKTLSDAVKCAFSCGVSSAFGGSGGTGTQ